MKSIEFRLSTSLREAVRLVKSESYNCKERVVAEFNDFILDSNKSEEDNLKDYYSQWKKIVDNNIDWEQRRYEIAKDVFCTFIQAQYPCNSNRVVEDTVKYTDALIEELKKKKYE